MPRALWSCFLHCRTKFAWVIKHWAWLCWLLHNMKNIENGYNADIGCLWVFVWVHIQPSHNSAKETKWESWKHSKQGQIAVWRPNIILSIYYVLMNTREGSGQIRVAKCQFFYTDQNLQSRFYPKTIAYIATILALKLNKTDDKGSFGEQMFQAYQIRLEADVGMANSNPYVW